MGEVLAVIVERLMREWHRPRVCVVGTLLVGGVLSYLISRGWTTLPGSPAVAFGIVAVASIPSFWLIEHRLPRTSRGKVGVVVAIAAERHEEQQQVQADFVATLRRLLSDEGAVAAQFEVVVLANYHSEQLIDAARAMRMLERVRGHFMLYGSVRWREFDGKEVPYLDLDGLIRHAPVPKEAREDLAVDFRRALPRRHVLLGTSEVLSFQATSEWLDTTARYIIGIAAYLSGDVALAEDLFLAVEKRLARTTVKYPPLREIARRLPQRIIALYEAWHSHLTDTYITGRDQDILRFNEQISSKLLDRDRDNYPALLTNAIAAFELRRDLVSAKALIRRCRRQKDGTWRYSRAFLLAYEGNLDEACAEYERAFAARTGNVTVPLQTEEFIQGVLMVEPEKYQLWFCSALINDRAKQDPESADRDYASFVKEAAGAGQFAKQVEIARAARLRLGRS